MKKKKEASMCNNCEKQFPFSGIRDFEGKTEQEHSAWYGGMFSEPKWFQTPAQSKKDTKESDPVVNCKYIDIENFKSVRFYNRRFNILHLNIAPLAPHKEELESVLENFTKNLTS